MKRLRIITLLLMRGTCLYPQRIEKSPLYRKKKSSLLLILLMVFHFTSLAQITIKGRVVDDKGQSIGYAYVVGYDRDSTRLGTTVTDTLGIFSLLCKNETPHSIKITSLGYQPLVLKDINKEYTGSFILHENIIETDDVTISATTNKMEGNKQTLLFSKKEKLTYPSAKSLIGSNVLFQEQRLSRGMKSIDGRNIIFLHNGIEISTQQLESIPSHTIRKVVYYDHPPARYANKKQCVVVDLITSRPKKREVTFNADLFDDFKMHYGKNTLAGQYQDSIFTFNLRYYRDYQDFKDIEYQDQYTFDNRQMSYMPQAGLFNSTIDNLSTDIQRDGLRSKFQLNLSLKKNKAKEEKLQKNSSIYRLYHLQSNNQGAAIRLYYSYDLTKNALVGGNLFYNYIEDSYATKHNTAMNINSLHSKNMIHQENQVHRYQGEFFYHTEIGKSRWHSGIKMDRKILTELNGINDAQLIYDNTYIYTSLSGKKWNKLSYYIGGGIEYISNQWKDQRVEDNKFALWNTDVVLSYPLTSKHTLKGSAAIVNNAPSISMMANNRIEIMDGYVSIGNPKLKAYYIGLVSFQHQYSSKKWYLQTKVKYQYFDQPFNTGYYQEKGIIYKSNLQQAYLKDLSLSCAFQWKASDLLKLGGYISWVEDQLKTNEGRTKSLQGYYISLNARGNFHHWFWLIEDREPYKNLNGENIETYGRNVFAEIGYRKKGWKISLWGFHQPENRNIEVNTPVIKIQQTSYWNDVQSILGANISYRISFGENNQRKKRAKIRFNDNFSTLSEDSSAKRH